MNKVILMGQPDKRPGSEIFTGSDSTGDCQIYPSSRPADSEAGRRSRPQILFRALHLAEQAEFAEKYYRQGHESATYRGRIQTGSYTNKDGHEGLYDRGCRRRTGICREQSCQ